MAKIRLRKKRYNFKTNKEIFMQIWHNNLKVRYYAMWKFHVRILRHIRKIIAVKERHGRAKPGRAGPGGAGLGRFGPGRFITDIGFTSKKNKFLFHESNS